MLLATAVVVGMSTANGVCCDQPSCQWRLAHADCRCAVSFQIQASAVKSCLPWKWWCILEMQTNIAVGTKQRLNTLKLYIMHSYQLKSGYYGYDRFCVNWPTYTKKLALPLNLWHFVNFNAFIFIRKVLLVLVHVTIQTPVCSISNCKQSKGFVENETVQGLQAWTEHNYWLCIFLHNKSCNW